MRAPDAPVKARRDELMAPTTLPDTTVTEETEPTHIHHWMLEEASGPLSRGSCRECHAERDFHNWLPELDFVTRTERNIA